MGCYDVIGDIHGQADKLRALLQRLGYQQGKTWRPPAGREAVFIGDLIDRGPAQRETIDIVRGMRDKGFAKCIMGNHEFNAIGYATLRRDGSGDHLRRHTPKNSSQHREFLKQVGENSPLHKELIAWFKTLPPALDLGVIRAVHAWWNQDYVDYVSTRFFKDGVMDEEFLHDAYERGSKAWEAMEGLTKGLETPLPDRASFFDHDGFERFKVRTRWWRSTPATYRDIAIVDEADVAGIPATQLPAGTLPALPDGAPIFIGHYWLRGTPAPQSASVACVDYSAAADGPLVAYRWEGEAQLDAANFITSG
jgi:hypothetical protein